MSMTYSEYFDKTDTIFYTHFLEEIYSKKNNYVAFLQKR